MPTIITTSMSHGSTPVSELLVADLSLGAINNQLALIASRIRYLDHSGNYQNSATLNDARWAVGNLKGVYGYQSDVAGAAFGVPDGSWLKIDPVNGVRIGFGTTTKMQIDAAGNATFTGSMTATSGTIGGWSVGATALTSGSGGNTVGLDSGGVNPAFYAGSATPGSAPFMVSQAGALTATSGAIAGWTISSSEIVGPSGVDIRSGQTAFDSGTGFWLGNALGTPKFSIGNSAGNKLTWDGSTLTIIGTVTASASSSIPDSTLSGNVALLNRAGQIFSGTNQFSSRVGFGIAADAALQVVVGNGTNTGYIHPGVGVGLSVGTKNASSLTLDTNNTARVTIDSTGNVGVGGVTPSYPLHVNGSTYVNGHLYVVAGGNLSLSGASSFVTTLSDSSGDMVLRTSNTDRAKLTTTGMFNPVTTFSYDIGSDATRWRSLYAAELRVQMLVAQKTMAILGGRALLGANTTKLTAGITAAATTITVDNNGLLNGDRIYLQSAPGGIQQIEFMAVTSAATDNGNGTFSYTVTRDLDTTGANTWNAGDVVFDTGKTGDGFIDMYAQRGLHDQAVQSVRVINGGSGYTNGAAVTFSAPDVSGGVTATGTVIVSAGVITGVTITNAGSGYLSTPTVTAPAGGSGAQLIAVMAQNGPTIVGNVRNSATWNDWTPRWAIGNLSGLYGYTTDTYGCAFGVPTAAWVKIDPTNGVRIGYNATTKIQLDASGNASFTGSITAASGTIGGWTIGATALTAGTGANTVGIDSGGVNPAFYAGSATPGSAPFMVSQAGALTATSGAIAGWTLSSTELVGPSGAAIRAGQTAYNTGTGFWIGNASGTPKFSIGDPTNNKYLIWNGTKLALRTTNVWFDDDFGAGIGGVSVSGTTAELRVSAGVGGGNAGGLQYSNGGPTFYSATNVINIDAATTGQIILRSVPKFSFDSTGLASAALGSNCPAVTAGTPYVWLKMVSSDGSTVYVPAWK